MGGLVDWLMIILRFVHVVSGALWVGMLLFTVVFLTPALRDAGPQGGAVMAALQRRGLMVFMPILALTTLVSGFWLFARFSAGSINAALATPVGLAFGLGGTAALLAFVVGMVLMRPVMTRLAALGQDPAANQAEIQRLRARGAAVGQVVAVLLVFTLSAMAVARYL